MRRAVGVVGLVVALALGALWWCHGTRNDSPGVEHPSGSAATRSLDRHHRNLSALAGRVTRAKDGAAIAGASITVKLAGERSIRDIPRLVTSDRDGRWSVSIDAGTYQVAATSEGYLPVTRERVDVTDGPAQLALQLVEGGVLITGTVTDIGGGAIDGARVSSVVDNEISIATLTRPDGTYRLSVKPGWCVISATHDDYMTNTKRLEVTVPLDEDFVLVPGGTIHGTVTARDTGRPIAGAIVTGGWNESGYYARVETEENGTFVLHSLPSGATTLYAQAAGYVTTDGTIVTLGIGEHQDAHLVADHGFSIRGRVVHTDRPSLGVSGVMVDAHTDSPVPDNRTYAETGPDGAFEIVGLAPAVYALTTSGADVLDARLPPIKVDKDVEGVTIALAGGATLRGRIDPPEPATASLYPTFGALWTAQNLRVTVEPDGTFVARNVPDGDLMLYARSFERQGQLVVHVAGKDVNNLVVATKSNGTTLITGSVVDDNGALVSRAKIITDDDAETFAVNGRFEVRARLPTMLRATGDDDPYRSKPVSVKTESEARNVVLKLVVAHEALTGRVIGDDGNPLADVWVSTYGHDPVLTGPDGGFAIRPIAKGTYTLEAKSARADAVATLKATTEERVTLTLHRIPDLHGRVSSNGHPVQEFEVTCNGDSSYAERRIHSPDGSFTIPRLHPSDRRPVTCSAANETGEGTASATYAGDAGSVVIELKPFATLTGTVVDLFSKRPTTGLAVMIDHGLGSQMLDGALTPHAVDANGRFRIGHLADDELRAIVVSAQTGHMLGMLRVHPVAGQELDVTIPVVPVPHGALGTFGFVLGEGGVVRLNDPLCAAAQAGIRDADTVLAIDGVALGSVEFGAWQSLFNNIALGDAHTFEFSRGITLRLTATGW